MIIAYVDAPPQGTLTSVHQLARAARVSKHFRRLRAWRYAAAADAILSMSEHRSPPSRAASCVACSSLRHRPRTVKNFERWHAWRPHPNLLPSRGKS